MSRPCKCGHLISEHQLCIRKSNGIKFHRECKHRRAYIPEEHPQHRVVKHLEIDGKFPESISCCKSYRPKSNKELAII